MSTALAATRRNFQAGLYGPDGTEVAFQTVDQIVELVRRGFLASGLGPAGSAAPLPRGGPPLPPEAIAERAMFEPLDLGPSPGGGAYFENAIRDDHLVTWRTPGNPVNLALEHLGWLVQKLGESVGPALQELIAAYAEATVIDWEQRVGHEDNPTDAAMLLDWYGALHDVGIWTNGRSLADFVRTADLYWGRQFLDGWLAPIRRGEAGPGRAPSRRQLISHAPCPRRRGWGLGLSRLADKLTLPMCIGNYFDTNQHLPELAPATLAAMLMTDHRFPPASLSGSRYVDKRLNTAVRWLAGETPNVELPKMAEDLINDYVWSCMEGTAGGPGPAAAGQPAPVPLPA
jgi:hypothetical protein